MLKNQFKMYIKLDFTIFILRYSPQTILVESQKKEVFWLVILWVIFTGVTQNDCVYKNIVGNNSFQKQKIYILNIFSTNV